METPKIGCIVLAEAGPYSQFVGLQCKKNRGTILPGGKWEPGETFKETARREFKEETGMDVNRLTLVFQGLCEDGYYVYAFLGKLESVPKYIETAEGFGVQTTFQFLKQSAYKGYYELLEEAYDRFVGP